MREGADTATEEAITSESAGAGDVMGIGTPGGDTRVRLGDGEMEADESLGRVQEVEASQHDFNENDGARVDLTGSTALDDLFHDDDLRGYVLSKRTQRTANGHQV